jgi:hypothetical protein
MSFNITLGNLSRHLTGPSNPTALGQLILTAADSKFTVHGAQAGQTLGPIAMNLPFTHFYGIKQEQHGGGKNGVFFGFCDEHGVAIGAQNQDQGMCMVGAGGHVPLYFKAVFDLAGDYTFTGNPG